MVQCPDWQSLESLVDLDSLKALKLYLLYNCIDLIMIRVRILIVAACLIFGLH